MARVCLAMVAVVSLIGGGLALADAPSRSMFPRPRPLPLAAPVMPTTPVPQTDLAVAQALGLARATATVPGALPRSLFPRVRAAGVAERTRPTPPRAGGAGGPGERGLCGRRALEGRRLAPITSSTRGCGVAEPVAITAVHGIPLSRPARVDCDLARAFADWVDRAMVPSVGRRGGGIARIEVIGDYSCRPRNNQPGARISEHGRGMAIDVAGYRLTNGERVTVAHDWRRRPHRRDLHRMYERACGTFRTTLSPDADRHHQDHFHFDLARHRNGGTYCH